MSINKTKYIVPKMKEYRKTHTPAETARKFGVSCSTLSYWGVIGPEKEKRLSCPHYLTTEQEETIAGNLLGDGCIPYIDASRGCGGLNNHFSIGQNEERAEYINGLFKIYEPFSCGTHERQNRKPSTVNGKINHDIENWNGEYSGSIMMYTINHPVFTALRKKWYKEPYLKRSPKIVPSDLRLTWRTAAIWMCDDGTNYVEKRNRGLKLYTDCFTVAEVEFLIDRIKKDLDVSARINFRSGKPNIKINGDEWFKFIEGIKPFIPWRCFQYKCVNRQVFKRGMKKGSEHWLAKVNSGKQHFFDILEKREWELLSEYTNRKMQLLCEHGKVFTRIRASVMKPNAECDCFKNVKQLNIGKQKFVDKISQKGWELVSEYGGTNKRVVLKCEHGKEFERWASNIRVCSKCDC